MPDPLGVGELLERRLPDRVEGPELGGQRPGRGGADVPDRQRDEHPPQRPVAGLLEVGEQPRARWPTGPGRPPRPSSGARVNSGTSSRSSSVEREQVALVLDDAGVEQRDRGLVAEHLDVEGARGRPRGRAARAAARGRSAVLGQRMSASPSFSGASSVPHSGQCVGITNSRSLPSRRSTTGPTISGITSPALRSTTVSPISTPLRAPRRRCAAWPSPPSSRRPSPAPSRRTASPGRSGRR